MYIWGFFLDPAVHLAKTPSAPSAVARASNDRHPRMIPAAQNAMPKSRPTTSPHRAPSTNANRSRSSDGTQTLFARSNPLGLAAAHSVKIAPTTMQAAPATMAEIRENHANRVTGYLHPVTPQYHGRRANSATVAPNVPSKSPLAKWSSKPCGRPTSVRPAANPKYAGHISQPVPHAAAPNVQQISSQNPAIRNGLPTSRGGNTVCDA